MRERQVDFFRVNAGQVNNSNVKQHITSKQAFPNCVPRDVCNENFCFDKLTFALCRKCRAQARPFSLRNVNWENLNKEGKLD